MKRCCRAAVAALVLCWPALAVDKQQPLPKDLPPYGATKPLAGERCTTI
jgi:hypothetical protein